MLETAWEPVTANMLATAGMPATTRRQQQQGHQGGTESFAYFRYVSLMPNKNKHCYVVSQRWYRVWKD